MRFKGIFQKIVLPMVLIVCLFGVSILAVVGSLFSDTYEKQIYSENDNMSNFVSQSVSSFMNTAYRITEELANMDAVLTMDTEVQTPILQGTAARNDYFELIYVQDMNGDQTGRSSGTLGNRANRWWFIQMLETNKPFISKSYYSISTNMACASIFIPLVSNNETIGILATDIKLAELQNIIDEFRSEENGRFSFIIDGEGVVVAHPESIYYEELYNYKTMTKTVTKTDALGNTLYDSVGNIITEEQPIEISSEYQSAISDVMSGKSGHTLIDDNGEEYYVSYSPITLDGYSDSWSVITLQSKSAAMSLMHRIIKTGITATVIAIAAAVLLISFITGTIIKPIKSSLTLLTDISNGNLQTVVPEVKGRDETAELLRVLGKTLGILRSIISDIDEHLSKLAQGDLTINTATNYPGDFNALGTSVNTIKIGLRNALSTIGLHSSKVFESANAISAAAGSLSRDTTSQASAVEELSASIRETSGHISTNADTTGIVSNKMAAVNSEMINSSNHIGELITAMEDIQNNANKISGISKLIQDVSFQTNLLSMNASVEASRAGEAGKGFSVIASEIRSLAAKCSEAALNTSELIKTTQKSLENGKEILDVTAESIHSAAGEANEANNLINIIAAATLEQSESVSQISKALEQISNVVQNNSSVSEENAALSTELADNAQNLRELMSHYKF